MPRSDTHVSGSYAATQFQAVNFFLRTAVIKKKVGARFYVF